MKGDYKVLAFAQIIFGHRRHKELGDLYKQLRPEHDSDDDAAAETLQHLTQEEVDMLWKHTKTGKPPEETT